MSVIDPPPPSFSFLPPLMLQDNAQHGEELLGNVGGKWLCLVALEQVAKALNVVRERGAMATEVEGHC